MTGAAHVLRSVPGLSDLTIAQRGVVSRDQLRRLGVHDHDVRQQLRAQRWASVSPLVLAVHTGPLTRPALIWAASLHCGSRALIGAWTALEVHGQRRWERAGVHAIVPRGTTVTPMAGLIVHESRRLDPEAHRDPARALPVVRAARAAIDSAAWSGTASDAAALIAAVVQQRICTVAELESELEVVGLVRRRGTILEALAEVRCGADTLGEMRLRPILAAAGLPAPRRQTRRMLGGVLRRTDVEVDLPDGSVLVIEIDGPDHDPLDRRADDTLRDLDHLAEARWTIRVTPWALVHRRRELIARLIAVRKAAVLRAAS